MTVPTTTPSSALLDDLRTRLKASFDAHRHVMSFEQYLDLFIETPRLQARSASQYVLDCFHHFGSTPLPGSAFGTTRRWKLFDAPWDAEKDRVVGQEAAQEAIYRIVKNFARQRQVNKLVLLHGPNGSAKSSLVGTMLRALEVYSERAEGALYSFNWVFPSKKVSKKRLGFGDGSERSEEPLTSFAFVDDEDVDARIPPDLRDHPLLLLPRAERRGLLQQAHERIMSGRPGAGETEAEGDEYQVPESLWSGDLSPRNRQIFDLLYASYQGDLRRVLQHVQVERIMLSRRYRRALVTVEPQMHVDASVRQLTGDRSLTSLPLVLQSTTLYEPFGDLVDAHRGIIEYNDLLKRPIDAFRYLISTCEKSSVALSNQTLYLDLLFLASSNESHLNALKEYADWASFKGRMELVRVPYLRCYLAEKRIYDDQVTPEMVHKRIAPHATLVAALWAVLTRLRRPSPERHQKAMKPIVGSLTPLNKADLYATGRTPKGYTLDKARLLRANARALADESFGDRGYEGQGGASPREMKVLLLNAAQRPEFPTLSPLAVLAELKDLVAQRSVYEFLRAEPDGPYTDHEGFIPAVRDRWIDLCDEELHRAMGLVSRDQYDEFFKRYLTHVSHASRGEKILNAITGALEEPDRAFLETMERHFKVDKAAHEFRSDLLGRIGGASQQGRLGSNEYRELFPTLFENLEASYYEAQRPTIRRVATAALKILSGEAETLAVADRRHAEEMLGRLQSDFGYCEPSAREMLGTLLSERYRE